MRKYLLAIAVILSACQQKSREIVTTHTDSVLIEEPKVAETRGHVSTAPAAAYSERISDELNDWKFVVELYETKRTFHYTVRVQAKEVRVSDSINIPDLGAEPRVEIRKGKQPLTCIIGFLDNKGVFKEYREVSFTDDKLRMRTVQHYAVGHYQKKIN